MNLKGHVGGLLEEAGFNIFYGLQDHFFARDLIRRVGPKSPEAGRFSEMGWAYGDPSYVYGTDPMEVFCHQAGVLAYTLFGQDLSLDLLFFYSGDDELYRFLAELRDEDGLAVSPLEEIEGLAEAAAGYGDAATMIAEFSGSPELIWRLKGALTSEEVGLSRPVLHYAPTSERSPGTHRSEHFRLTYDCEPYPEREVIHHELFDYLIRAWEVMRDART